MADNSAFISYRRDTGYPWARLVWDELRQRSVNVFLDVENLREAGRFDQRILKQIAARPYFLVVIADDSLDRCASETDWVRREVEHAIDTRRIIVPLFIAPFEPNRFSAELPTHIGEVLANSNGVTFHSQYVMAALDQLIELLRPIDLLQVDLTDDDAQFEELAKHRVQSDQGPAPPPTAPIAVEPEAVPKTEPRIGHEPNADTPRLDGVATKAAEPLGEASRISGVRKSSSREADDQPEATRHDEPVAPPMTASLLPSQARSGRWREIVFASVAAIILGVVGIVALANVDDGGEGVDSGAERSATETPSADDTATLPDLQAMTTEFPRTTGAATGSEACPYSVGKPPYMGQARNETSDLNGAISVEVTTVVSRSCVVVLDIEWTAGLEGRGEDVTGTIDELGAGRLTGNFVFRDESYNLVVDVESFTAQAISASYVVTARQAGPTVASGSGTFTAFTS